MTYCANTDIDLAFGRENARKWADVDNTRLQASIDARYEWARENAYDELNSRLAAGPYSVPVEDPPALLVRMEAFLAGVLLYESRGVTDRGERGEAQHALAWHRKRVDQFVQDVHARRVKLTDVESAVTEVPDFVTFDDPSLVDSTPTLDDDLFGFSP